MDSNNTKPLEHFVLKENGLIYWIEKMPEDQVYTHDSNYLYRQELQSAIDNAVEVSNQEEVLRKLFADNKHKINASYGEWIGQAEGKVYSLQCRVEKKEREIAQCCECDKSIYKENRFQRDDGNGFTTSVCPECGEESFYNLKEVLALVTFSEPEQKETQEEVQWQIFREMYLMCVDQNGIDLELATKYFIINRKP